MKKMRKSPNMWKLNKTILINPWALEPHKENQKIFVNKLK